MACLINLRCTGHIHLDRLSVMPIWASCQESLGMYGAPDIHHTRVIVPCLVLM